MNKRKWLERGLCLAVLSALVPIIYFGVNGVPLPHPPKAEHVVSVEVYVCTATSPSYEYVKETFTDREHIERACEMVAQLRYAKRIPPKADFSLEPEVSLTFTMDDGSVEKFGIVRAHFSWHQKSYDAKDTTQFFDSVGAFFDLETQE